MYLREKPIANVEESDIESLVNDRVPESFGLEYKEALPDLGRPEGKKKFLADVTAFANKWGGTVVYGISEEQDDEGKNTGIPKDIKGINEENEDQLAQRITNLLRDLVQPSLMSCTYRLMTVEGRQVFLLGIPRSLLAPHMIWFEQLGKFYSRSQGSKHIMGIDELRQAFLETQNWRTRAEQFRTARISVFANMREFTEYEFACPFFVHVVPLGRDAETIDINKAKERCLRFNGRFELHLSYPKFNLDGVRIQDEPRDFSSYYQIFRNGSYEGCFDCSNLGFPRDKNSPLVLEGPLIAGYIEEHFQRFQHLCTELQILPPFGLFLTVLNVKGRYLRTSPDYPARASAVADKHFDRDQVYVPGVWIDDLTGNTEDLLRNSYDMLWQAAGFESSPFRKSH